ncbi:MAG TPA: hypothetical protein PLK12_12345 [Prolixibacteraceae bacterium]|nr:hypothetical protein [Prolixibacteraceae bacterium]
MKKLLTLSVLLILAFGMKAADPVFLKGDKVINVGIGLETWRLPLYVSGEFGIADGILEKGSIGIGAYAGASFSWYSYYSSAFAFMAGARGAFHYPFIDKLDTYIGISLGLDSWYSYWISPGGFIGARYPISEKLHVFLEAGTGLGYLTGGISFKL